MFRMYRAALTALLVTGFAAFAAAQQNSSVTQADIQRLQDNAYQASIDVLELRGRGDGLKGCFQCGDRPRLETVTGHQR